MTTIQSLIPPQEKYPIWQKSGRLLADHQKPTRRMQTCVGDSVLRGEYVRGRVAAEDRAAEGISYNEIASIFWLCTHSC